jgi:predicted MFS family arabinose efflux permease
VSILQAAISTASVTSMALGGIFGDVLGIRSVFVIAGTIALGAAALSWVMFRGVSGRPAQAATTPPLEPNAT